MAAKQKRDPEVVEIAERVLKDPTTLTGADGQRMAARIVADEKDVDRTEDGPLARKIDKQIASDPRSATRPAARPR